MEDRTLHPSMKTVQAAYALALLVLVGGIWVVYKFLQIQPDEPRWLYAIPWIALLFPFNMHLKRRMVTLQFHDDHMTFETGYFSRMRRTVDMAKIQDVTVNQTFGQRLMGTGDLRIESAGEGGAMMIHNLDRPREIADAILATSSKNSQRPF